MDRRYEFSIIGNGVLVFAVVLRSIKNDIGWLKAEIRQEEKVRWYTLRSKK
ncbi:MAG: hypothetical protein ACLVJ6_01850 [Merdibacter sp.]